MRIGIDIDGTLTDFEGFLIKKSQEYMYENFGLKIVNPEGYDLDRMYDLENVFISRGYSLEEAKQKSKKILDDYWQKFFAKYLVAGLRENVSKIIKTLYYNENKIVIFSSRKKTTEKSFFGRIVRYSTLAMLKSNGIKADEILFFENDIDKVKAIKEQKMELVWEDKPELVEEISKFAKVLCVDSSYNKEVKDNKNVYHISEFNEEEVLNIFNEISIEKGGNKIPYPNRVTFYNRVIKKISKHQDNYKANDVSYGLVRTFGSPFLMKKFNPIILNPERANIEGPAIISPNHRSTIDPFFVLSTTDYTIHWAALKRFFDAKDSIANNRKMPILRYLTAGFFRITGAIPVDRISDNPRANNREAVQRMRKIVNDNRKIGIFPEGTTNKKPDEQYLVEGERSGSLAFILLREGLGTKMLPISIHWIKKPEKIGHSLILNYREPFTVEDVQTHSKLIGEPKFTDAAYSLWKEKIIEGLEENINLTKSMEEEYDLSQVHGKQKVYYNNGKTRIR